MVATLIMPEFYHFSAHKTYQLSIITCLWYLVNAALILHNAKAPEV